MEGVAHEDNSSTIDGIYHKDESCSEITVTFMGANNPDQWPHLVLRGPLADLAALPHKGAHSAFFTGPRALLQEGAMGIPCRVKWGDGEESEGEFFITISQALFGSSSSSEDGSTDWAIGATCIKMHAMADDPEPSIHLQVSEGSDGEDYQDVTLIPLDPSDCDRVFDGLCKLVNRHPVELDDDEDGTGFCGGGEDGFDAEDMIWAPSAGVRSMGLYDDENDEDGPSETEREAMLHRLDNILVVLPELDVREGQFDDAEEAAGESELQQH
jgi:hypothetical protein